MAIPSAISAKLHGLINPDSSGPIGRRELITILEDLFEDAPGAVGTPGGAYAVAGEYGNPYRHHTLLTVATTLPAIAGGANLGVGKLLYTFPAGPILVNSVFMSLGITQTQGNINADTPDVGMGTVIASGAVAVLGGTATFENLVNGVAAANCTGTATAAGGVPTAGVPLAIAAGAAHTVHFNCADGWAASGDAAALLAGYVIIDWSIGAIEP